MTARETLGGSGAIVEGQSFSATPRSPIVRLRLALESERAQWFLWSPVLFGLGIATYFDLAAEPALGLALAPFAVALALLAMRSVSIPMVLLAAGVAVTGGFAAAKARTEWVRAPVLERRLDNVEVRGFVELVEPRPARGVRISLRVSSISGLPGEKAPLRIRVRTSGTTASLAPGDAVRLWATLAPPAAPPIPGGYDFARAAWFAGIGGVGYARRAPEPDRDLGEPPLRLVVWSHIERVRQDIGRRIRSALPGETGAIANALVTGERGGISEATNEAYRNSGLLHILSISGLHMVVMAGAVFYAVRLLLACSPALALRHPIKKWAAVIAAIVALGYLLISGAAFATVRSYVMISIAFLAVLLDRPAIAMRNVAIAALMILALYPESLLDVGFQMSFAAVGALVAAHEVVRRWLDARDAEPPAPWSRPLWFLGGIVGSTLVAGAAVAPFAAYHFHTSQQFAVIANVMAIPICNLIVMPAALLTLVLMPLGLEAPALWLMGQGIEAVTWCARFAADLPGAVGRIAAMPQTAFLAMVGGGLWLCLWSARWRVAGLAGLATGAALAASPDLPDVLAGRDGGLVAVRGADGLLAASGGRGADFELKRWLEHDGDGRSTAEASRAKGLSCDVAGCVAAVKGSLVAASRGPSSLDDDCRRARILVLDRPAPRGCIGPEVVLDFFKMRNEGVHAIYISGDGAIRVESVAQLRGERPWAFRGTLGERAARTVAHKSLARSPSRDARSTQPRQADPDVSSDRGPQPRPEIEEEDLELRSGEPY